jgi:hypothetical protein
MVKDYLAGWFDACGIMVINKQKSGVYPVLRLAGPSFLGNLMKENFGGHLREGMWEITKKGEAIRVLKEFGEILIEKRAPAIAMLDILQSKNPSIEPMIERFKRLQAGEVEE